MHELKKKKMVGEDNDFTGKLQTESQVVIEFIWKTSPV